MVFVRRLTFLVLAGVAISCAGNRRPADVLSREDMVRVMLEIYVAEDKVSKLSVPSDSAQKVFAIFRDKLPERTGVPDSVFRRSLEYYRHRPKEMEAIFTALVDSLNLRQQRAPGEQPAQQ